MKNNIIVSIIIPVYNTENYLTRCLDSVVNQTLREIEIICVNDGSTDNSLKILKEYASKDNRIKIITQENSGAAAARNNGIDNANGDYLYFLDSDDYVYTSICEKMYSQIKKEDADICLCKRQDIIAKTHRITDKNFSICKEYIPSEFFNRNDIPNKIFQVCPTACYTKLYKKSFVNDNNIRFQKVRIANDVYFNTVTLALANKITYVEDYLVISERDREGSLSVDRHKYTDCLLTALNAVKQRLETEKIFVQVKSSFYSYAVTLFVHILETYTDNTKRHETAKKLNEFLPSEYKKIFKKKLKKKMIETAFSLKNEYSKGKKNKVLTIFGKKINFYNKNEHSFKVSKYLITGGGFANKGSESMLYTLITELKEREPDCEIVVQAIHGWDENSVNDKYNFTIIKDCNRCRRHLLNPFYLSIDKLKSSIFKKDIDSIRLMNVIKTSDVIYDISGYSLSSQWGPKPNKRIMQTIALAKKFKKKLIFLPQSFGPFDFKGNKKSMEKFLYKALSNAYLIFARENDGYNILKDLGLTNVYLSSDMVLQSNKEYKNIYTQKPVLRDLDIKQHSILVIPNTRVFERCKNSVFFEFYLNSITCLTEKNLNIYIAYYDTGDRELCLKIKDLFKGNNKVNLIDENLNCETFSKNLPKFDFLISSRYHSIVHAYKKNIPCLVLGWAVKYKELLFNVKQKDMFFDIRNDIDYKKVYTNLDYLTSCYKIENTKIKNEVEKIQRNSCFDKIWSSL